MKQIFPVGTSELLDTDFEPYILNLFSWIEFPYFSTVNHEASSVIPIEGTFTNLRIRTHDPVTQSVVFDITPLGDNIELTLNSGETEKIGNGNRAVSGGALFALLANINGNPGWTDVAFDWGIMFTPADGVSAIMVSTQPDDTTGLGSFGARHYNHINTLEQAWTDSTIERRYFIAPMDFTITNFYSWVNQTINSTTTSFSIYKNGSEEASSIVTYNNGQNGTKSATGLSISVSQGDILMFSVISTGAASESGAMSLAFSYTPASPGEFMLGGFTGSNLSTVQNTVQYGSINGADNGFGVESKYPVLITEQCKLKNFTVNLRVAPGASQTRVFRLRLNGANSGSSVTISGTDTVETDATVLNLEAGDTINVATEPTTATTAASHAQWSAVIYDVSANTIKARPIYFN